MSELRPCGFPGCVALARNDVFCSSHAAMIRAATQPESRRDRAESGASLLKSILKIAGDERREFRDIRVAPLPIPGFLDFQFHSPNAILMVNEALGLEDAGYVVFHELAHVRQQRQRFRCRRYAGRVKRLGMPGCDARIVPWDDVETARGIYQIELASTPKAHLSAHTPRCRRCGCDSSALTWLYFVNPLENWRTLGGMAGWMAICEPCHEQIALFIDRQN